MRVLVLLFVYLSLSWCVFILFILFWFDLMRVFAVWFWVWVLIFVIGWVLWLVNLLCLLFGFGFALMVAVYFCLFFLVLYVVGCYLIVWLFAGTCFNVCCVFGFNGLLMCFVLFWGVISSGLSVLFGLFGLLLVVWLLKLVVGCLVCLFLCCLWILVYVCFALRFIEWLTFGDLRCVLGFGLLYLSVNRFELVLLVLLCIGFGVCCFVFTCVMFWFDFGIWWLWFEVLLCFWLMCLPKTGVCFISFPLVCGMF